jgi:phosphoglycerate dehydrogenase-like enzyme
MTEDQGGRPVCAVLDDYQGVALTSGDWSRVSASYDVRVVRSPLASVEDARRVLADCTVVVAMRERTPFPQRLLAALPHLRLLVTTGMANASIDLEAARAQGIVVCGTESSSDPPAELTWALILAVARRVADEAAAVRTGGWQHTVGLDLHGKTLGVLGLGRIGSRVARVGTAFEMPVQAWSSHLEASRCAELGVRLAPSLPDLLSTSDVVSIHLRLSDRTRGLLAETELRSMRRTSVLVNTSRAEIVDQAVLARALADGWIAGAGLDVFSEEPLPADSALRQLPNVVATPHLGYVTEDNYRTFYGQAVDDICAFDAGEPVRTLT